MFPLRIFTLSFSRRIFVGAMVSLASLMLTALFLYKVYADPLPRARAGSALEGDSVSGTVYLSGSEQAAADAVPAAKKEPTHEVNIANNGLTLLRGATVISSSHGTIRVAMNWGSADFTWTIETANLNTKFMTAKGERATIRDIEVGDIITVTGMLQSSGREPVIKADYIRE